MGLYYSSCTFTMQFKVYVAIIATLKVVSAIPIKASISSNSAENTSIHLLKTYNELDAAPTTTQDAFAPIWPYGKPSNAPYAAQTTTLITLNQDDGSMRTMTISIPSFAAIKTVG